MTEQDVQHSQNNRPETSPAVSVIIPCHNAAEFLADALDSLREQTLATFECLIVDDSSTDQSRSIAERFAEADRRFRVLTLRNGRGVSAARNAGMAAAVGQWVTWLDADDLFVPRRLEVLVGLGNEQGADLIFDDQLITEYPEKTSTHHAFGFSEPHSIFTQEDFFAGSRLFRRSFPTGYIKPLIGRAFLAQSGAAFDPSVPSGEDFLFYASLFAQRPRCISTSFAGYVYRRRYGSVSRSEEHLYSHAKLGDRVLSEFGRQLSPVSRAALAGRRRDFEAVASAMPTLNALRSRDWKEVVLTLMRKPSAVGTCARLLETRLVRGRSRVKRAAWKRDER